MKYKVFTIAFITIIFGLLFSSCRNSGNPDNLSPKDIVLSTIENRKSVRNFIKERPVTDEDIEKLLRAGMSAPSGRDLRPWELLVINDRETLDAMAAELPTAKMLADAPMAIVVCGDTTKSFYWYLDCAAVSHNILLAAEAIELGSVWTAAYPYRDRMEIVIKNTNMPAHILPLAVLPIGYPQVAHSKKDKYDPKRIHRNKW